MKYCSVFKNKFYAITTALLVTLAPGNSIAQQALDKIIAVVNEDVITQNELNNRVADFIVQLKIDKTSESDIKALTKQVLERMINTRIQMQRAKQLGITIDDISLNRMIEKIAKSNKLTLEQLSASLASDGINFEHFREQTREELIVKQLQQRMVASKLNVSDQEIQRFIANNANKSNKNIKYNIQHILVTTPESATPEAIIKSKEKVDKIYSEIKNGADFTTLAIQESAGRNALKGGALGWRTGNELPESFVDAVKDLSKGETAAPVRSASGFHILKLLDSSSSKNMVTQTLARHILIRTSSQISDDDARNLLADIKARINAGEDFAKLANEHSQDPGSKIKGGDLGWADPGTYVSEFEDVMASLKNNEISEPFRSQFGWHIMQVLERREQDKTQSNLRTQASNAIHKRKYDEELRLWTRRIRDEAFVEYIDNADQ